MTTLIISEHVVKAFEDEPAIDRNTTRHLHHVACPLCPWQYTGKVGEHEESAVAQAKEHYRKFRHRSRLSTILEAYAREVPERTGRLDA